MNTAGRFAGRAAAGLAVGALALTGLSAVTTAANAAAPGFAPKSALINGDSVSTTVGILKGETPISLEQYAAERAGFTVTVVTGAQWSALSTADFAKYQLLIVGDNRCDSEDEESEEDDDSGISTLAETVGRWAPAVMGTTPANSVRGNRVLSGLDPSYHYTDEGEGGGKPTDPANPASAPTEHFVEASLRFAGAIPNATGVYLSPGCIDNPLLFSVFGNALSASGTGFTAGDVDGDSDAVELVTTPGATFPGLAAADLPDWSSTSHTGFHTFPSDYRPLAIADATEVSQPNIDSAKTARASDKPKQKELRRTSGDESVQAAAAPTCGTKVGGGQVCGDPVVVYAGADTTPEPLTCLGKKATILGTPGNDVITGTKGRDVIVSLGGNDVIRGKGGKDLICAGSGDDRVLGGSGRDRIYGQDGNDQLFGGKGRDRISGGAGNDKLVGGEGPDRLSGDSGDDKLVGGEGPDTLLGGPGNDVGDGGPGKNFYDGVESHP